MKYLHKSLYFPNQIFLWLELQSTSFVADQKLPYLDFAGRRFRIGRLEDKKVIIVMTGLSMLNAGISTQLLQTLFKVKAVVHYGIAGNADPQLQIGDVTIPQFWLIQAFGIGRILGRWRQKLVALLDMMRTSLTV